jgi:hypothetical protein
MSGESGAYTRRRAKMNCQHSETSIPAITSERNRKNTPLRCLTIGAKRESEFRIAFSQALDICLAKVYAVTK